MRSRQTMKLPLLAGFGLVLCLIPGGPGRARAQDGQDSHRRFRLSSTTFKNNATLPLSMIGNSPSPSNPSLNTCTQDGSPGGNQSPQLSWSHAPRHTRSFVVIAYDVTAAFTHWGLYNISPETTQLPENAGVTGSAVGTQVYNDFADAAYDGPCPPTSFVPLNHHYMFTVYALDTKLRLVFEGIVFPPPPGSTSPPHFPSLPEGLYHTLLKAAREGHILASSSISGFYSAAAPPGPAE